MIKIILTLVVVLTYSGIRTRAQAPEAKALQTQATRIQMTKVDSTKLHLQNVVREIRLVRKAIDSLRDTTLAKNIVQKPACVPVLNNISDAEWWLIFLPALTFIFALAMLLYKTRDFTFKAALKENEVSKITVINPYYSGQVTDPGETDVPLTIEVTPNVTIAAAILNRQSTPKQAYEDQDTASQATHFGDVGNQEVKPNAGLQPGQPPEGGHANPKTGLSTLYNLNYQLNPEVYPQSISRYIALISSLLIIMIAVAVSCFFIYHYVKFGCPPELGALTSVLLALGVGIVPYVANRVSSSLNSGKSEA